MNILEITSPCDANVDDMFAMETYRKRFILRSTLLTATMPKSTMVGITTFDFTLNCMQYWILLNVKHLQLLFAISDKLIESRLRTYSLPHFFFITHAPLLAVLWKFQNLTILWLWLMKWNLSSNKFWGCYTLLPFEFWCWLFYSK